MPFAVAQDPRLDKLLMPDRYRTQVRKISEPGYYVTDLVPEMQTEERLRLVDSGSARERDPKLARIADGVLDINDIPVAVFAGHIEPQTAEIYECAGHRFMRTDFAQFLALRDSCQTLGGNPVLISGEVIFRFDPLKGFELRSDSCKSKEQVTLVADFIKATFPRFSVSIV